MGGLGERGFRRILAALAALAGLAAAAGMLAFLTPELVWDDVFLHASFREHPWRMALGPFDFAARFWRPLATSSLALGWSSQAWLGAKGSILAAKAMSAAIFGAMAAAACAACVAGAAIPKARRGAAVAAVAALGAFMALGPAMAEPALWMSDRGDLLLCALLTCALWSAFARPAGSAWIAFGLGAAMGLSKEAGILWCLALCLATLRHEALHRWSMGFGAACAVDGLLWKIATSAFAPSAALGAAPAAAQAAARPLGGLALAFLESLGRAAGAVLAPWSDPCAIHAEGLGSPWSKAAGALVLAGGLWMAFRILRRRGSPERTLSDAFALCALAMLAIFSAYAVLSTMPGESTAFSIQRDRYVAPSLAVWAILLARRAALSAGWASRASLAALAAACALHAPGAAQPRRSWGGNQALWGACAAMEGAPAMASINLARAAFADGDRARARAVAENALRERPDAQSCVLWAVVEASGEIDPAALKRISSDRARFPPCPEIEGVPLPGASGAAPAPALIDNTHPSR